MHPVKMQMRNELSQEMLASPNFNVFKATAAQRLIFVFVFRALTYPENINRWPNEVVVSLFLEKTQLEKVLSYLH